MVLEKKEALWNEDNNHDSKKWEVTEKWPKSNKKATKKWPKCDAKSVLKSRGFIYYFIFLYFYFLYAFISPVLRYK